MGPLKVGQSKGASDEERARAHVSRHRWSDFGLADLALARCSRFARQAASSFLAAQVRRMPAPLGTSVAHPRTQDEGHNQGSAAEEDGRCRLLPAHAKANRRLQAHPRAPCGREHDPQGRAVRLWLQERVGICATSLRVHTHVISVRRKKCCYPWVKGDLLRFIATMIKISNHLCLILPCRLSQPPFGDSLTFSLDHKDNHEQVRATDSPPRRAWADEIHQNQRNREWTNIAFPDEDTAPRYGTAMLQPDLCGKWLVRAGLLCRLAPADVVC
jgi:hypothetical protein